MNIKKYFFPIISLLVIFTLYHKTLFSPNEYIFGGASDGITHFFTYAFYIQNNSDDINFEGMNYPYGEHINYAVGHPLLAFILKKVSHIIPAIGNYSIGILNLILILQFLITAWILFLLLKKLKVQDYLAAIAAVGIMLLAPQVFRLSEHPSLSYGFCVPLSWFLSIKIQEQWSGYKWWIMLTLVNTLWFFFHPYLAVISIGFSLLFLIVSLNFSEKRNIFLNIKIFAMSILPMVIFSLFNLFTDTHENRTNNPSGFFLYNAEPDDLLVPHHPPLRPLLNNIVNINLVVSHGYNGG
jgi:hypothetical protein